MLKITTELKRFKILQFIGNIVVWCFGFPFAFLFLIGKLGELVFSFYVSIYYKIEKKIVEKLKWDEVALERHNKKGGIK